MLKLIRLLSLIALVAIPTLAHAAEAMKKYGEAYQGPKNELVKIAYFDGKDEALVYITGVNSVWDDKIMKVTVRPGARDGKDFVTTYKKSDFVVLTKRTDYGSESVELSLPEMNDAIPLNFDKEMSADINPNNMRTTYESQAK